MASQQSRKSRRQNKIYFFSDYRSLGKLFSKLYLSNHIEIEKLVWKYIKIYLPLF